MDFNRKLENLLQDIREIENDAVDVSNSREISKIEMDILMEKVRRLYDQLIQIDRNYPYGSAARKDEVPFEVSDNRSAEKTGHSYHQPDQMQDQSAQGKRNAEQEKTQKQKDNHQKASIGKDKSETREDTDQQENAGGQQEGARQKESSDHGRIKDSESITNQASDTDQAEGTHQQGEPDKETAKEEATPGKKKEVSEQEKATVKPSAQQKASAVNSEETQKAGDKTNTRETESWKASRDHKAEGPEVVADKYQNSRTFRHDDLAKKQPQNNLSTRMQSRPINDLAKAIGLNDKFLFIRELFNGDKEKYHEAIQIINEMPSYEEAENYIRERFNWDEEQPEVEKFMDLVRRKFSEIR
jgi:hypothetical protein